MNKFLITTLLYVILSGCSEYPGHRPSDSIKPASQPPWPASGSIEVGGDCHIDSINDESAEETLHTVSSGEPTLRVSGWGAISVADGVTAKLMAISLKPDTTGNHRLFVPVVRIKRADVAKYFSNSALVDTGFNAVLDLSEIPANKYTLQVVMNRDEKSYGCKYTSTVVVD